MSKPKSFLGTHLESPRPRGLGSQKPINAHILRILMKDKGNLVFPAKIYNVSLQSTLRGSRLGKNVCISTCCIWLTNTTIPTLSTNGFC